MHAPQYACEALYRLDPNMRFCWIGDKPGGEQNEGHFGIIRLYDECAFARNDVVFYEYVYRRGPIFSRHGVPDRRDWGDRVYPFLALRLDDTRAAQGWGPRHVFSGGFIAKQARSMCPQWALDLERYEFLLEKGKEVDAVLEDAARQRASEFEHSIRFNPNYVLIDKAEIRQAIKDEGPDFDPKGPSFRNHFVEKFGTHLKTRPT